MPDPRKLSFEQLAAETRTEHGMLQRLIEIGVITPDADGLHAPGDIFRVEAVDSFLASGFTLEQVERALGEGLFTFEYLNRFYSEPSPVSETTVEDLAKSSGVNVETLAAVYAALGLADPEVLHDDDVDIFGRFVDVWAVDEDAMLRAARLIGDPVRALTEGWTRLYVEKISRPLDGLEIALAERTERIVTTTEKATQLAPQMLLWLFQKHLRHSIAKANIEGLEELMVRMGLEVDTSKSVPAIAFVDTSGYTAMTEFAGDAAAVDAARALRRSTEEALRKSNGSLVKLLGDGVMLYFPSAQDSVETVVKLIEMMQMQHLPSHAGIHAGPVIEHDGDYYGRTVNLAARVAGVAGPGEVAVTGPVLSAMVGDDRYAFDQIGMIDLKGVSEPTAIWLLKASRVRDRA